MNMIGQHSKGFGGHWAAEIVALSLVAILNLQQCRFLLSFYTLSNNLQLKASTDIDDCPYDIEPVRSVGHLTDEGLVNFEGVEWKFMKVAQAGVARAEVVEGYCYSSRAEALKDRRRIVGITSISRC
jgi:hypothetical protein